MTATFSNHDIQGCVFVGFYSPVLSFDMAYDVLRNKSFDIQHYCCIFFILWWSLRCFSIALLFHSLTLPRFVILSPKTRNSRASFQSSLHFLPYSCRVIFTRLCPLSLPPPVFPHSGAAADLWCAHSSCMYNVFPNRVEFKVHSRLFALIFPSVCFGNFFWTVFQFFISISICESRFFSIRGAAKIDFPVSLAVGVLGNGS